MFSSKSAIYRGEWLELVFANRNKGYGAYELRQSYNRTLAKALAISCSLILVVLSGLKILGRTEVSNSIMISTSTPTDTLVIKQYNGSKSLLTKPEKVFKDIAKAAGSLPKNNTATKRFVSLTVVSSNTNTEEPPRIDELQRLAIGTENSEGPLSKDEIGGIADGGTGIGKSKEAGGETGSEVFETVEKLPAFPGGVAAFSKYLTDNLQYPDRAAEENISGKVFVSFIVEKNGMLTDFEILRRVGYGCDEEAIRVLKKAPAWIPGEQNGKKVRVRYTIPIVFQLAE